jgi:hypothetical protein
MVAMVTEAWTLAGCGVAACKSSSSAVVSQEVPMLLYPAAKKPTSSVRGVAVSSSTCPDRDAVVVGRRRGIASCLLAALAVASGAGMGTARAAILEADDDLELLERVKEDKKKRLQKQGLINSSTAETGQPD